MMQRDRGNRFAKPRCVGEAEQGWKEELWKKLSRCIYARSWNALLAVISSWPSLLRAQPSKCLGKGREVMLLFSHSVVFYSLWLHGLPPARLPCPLLSSSLSQTRVHWVDDAIQPSHPLSPPYLPPLNLSQHQALSQWLSSAAALERSLQPQ